MRLTDLGLPSATLARLRSAGINTTYRLLEHTCRELIWNSEIDATDLYDILRALHRHGLTLKPNTKGIERSVSERNLEVFRLRVVEGRKLREVAARNGIGVERVRQVLACYFGLRGEPPAVKARRHQRRSREAK